MEEETRYTKQDLETMRAWTLQRKIQVTQTRLIEWLGRYDWNVYVSFSGGKDSTVLADLAARVYQVFSCPKRQDPLRLVFVNTGLEYPEIQKFVRDFAEWLKAKYKIPVELEILHPSMTFPQVLSKYGYPVISKETAKVIYYARRGSRWAINRLDGLDKHGNESKFKERFKKYKFLIDAPFETSQLCCDVMKKGPAHRYEAETGRKPILERQVNGGAWAQVYKGINRSYTDAITFGWTSVAYRVKAYDSAGAESAYNTSATRTVVNNHAPVISGTDSNLGTKTAAFTQSYSVTDKDSGQTLTVTEYIDGTQKRSYTATSGQTYSFNITAAEWVKLLNGSHTLKIVAADNYGGSATRTYTFTKNETEIELMLATPLAADDMVTKGIMSVVRQIPAGAKFTVEVCNNGNDASPTWEDVTQNIVSGSKFFLFNTTKTASAWGYNFRIKVKRGTATGDCFITSAGGNFE